MTTPEEFVALLKCLTLADNAQRNAAEQQFRNLRLDNPSMTLLFLAEVVRSPQVEIHIKHLALVLFRRSVLDKDDSSWVAASAASKRAILTSLQTSLSEVDDHNIRMKVAELAGEIASNVVDSQDWPEILQMTAALCQRERAEDKIIGLILLGHVTFVHANTNPQFLSVAAGILLQAFQAFTGHGDGSVAAISALNCLLQSIQQPSQWEPLRPIIGHMFIGLGQLLTNFSGAPAGDVKTALGKSLVLFLEHVVDIADHSPQFLQQDVPIFVPAIFPYVRQSCKLPSSIKQPLLEVLVLVGTKLPKQARKLQSAKGKKGYYLSEMLKLAEELMIRLSDAPRWETMDTVEELDGNSQGSFELGESAFRRVVQALGVNHIYKRVSTTITSLFQDGTATLLSDRNAWKKLYAALMMTAVFVEVTVNVEDENQLAVHRHEVFSSLHQFLTFPQHPAMPSVSVARIRFAAYQALSSYLLFHGSSMSQAETAQLLQFLLGQLNSEVNPAPRLRRSALISLIHTMESLDANSNILRDGGPVLLQAICETLHHESVGQGSTIVQESAIAALVSFLELTKSSHSSSSASTSVLQMEAWATIYGNLMPLLRALLQSYQQRRLESLWAQTLECITLLGEAVGVQVFYQDAKELLGFLREMQSVVEPHSDVDLALLKATVRVARCLGQEFAPHVHETVARIFAALTQEVIVSDSEVDARMAKQQQAANDDIDLDDDGGSNQGDDEGDDEDDEDDDNGVQMLETLEGHWVPVRTAIVEEQLQALHMLGLLLHTPVQQAAFFPYLQQTLQFLQTALFKSPHEDLRGEVLGLLPTLVQVAVQHYRTTPPTSAAEATATIQQVTTVVLGLLLPYLEKETNVELIMTGLETLRSVLSPPADKSTTGVELSDPQLNAVLQGIKMIVRDSVQRRAILRAEHQMDKRHSRSQPGRGGKSSGGGVFRTAPPDSDEENDPDEEDDQQDEQEAVALFQETVELHYHLAEVLGAMLRSHGTRFMAVLVQQGGWEMLISLSHAYCLVEDRRFAFLVFCDVLEHGVDLSAPSADVVALVTQGVQILGECVQEMSAALAAGQHVSNTGNTGEGSTVDSEVLRCAVYGLGALQRRLLTTAVSAEVRVLLESVRGQCLPLLQQAIAGLMGQQQQKQQQAHVAAVLDNAVRSLGIMVHVSLVHQQQQRVSSPDELWSLLMRYFQYLPLRHDPEENERACLDLLGMLTPAGWPEHVPSMALASMYAFVAQQEQGEEGAARLIAALAPLVQMIYRASDLSLSNETVQRIVVFLHRLLQSPQRLSDDFYLLPRLYAAVRSSPLGQAEEAIITLQAALQEVAASI